MAINEKVLMLFKRIQKKAFLNADASSIAIFRIGFGIIMLWEVFRYWNNGWIQKYYIDPKFYFKYYGFDWVQPWADDGMYLHFAVMGLLACLIIIGAFYRVSIILFTLAFAYVFLLDQTRYLNHFYLVLLISVLLCFIPAHRYISFDAWRNSKSRPSAIKLHKTGYANTVPFWTIWILRIQLEIMLVYAGIVKINPDWLQLEPLRMWLEQRHDFPLGLGYLFTQDWSIAIAAYGVILLHIVGAPLLLVKRTRLFVFCLYAAFHTLNHFVFSIGIFPWFTLFASLIFFDPDWPKALGSKFDEFRLKTNISPTPTQQLETPALQKQLTLGFIAIWITAQVLIPIRHLLYPGNVSWTEQGHRFSWQMKLRDKTGWANFYVTKPGENKKIWLVESSDFLTPKQTKKMTTRPDMLLQFAHYLAQVWQQEYQLDKAQVTASVFISLNGREYSLLLDPERDLSKVNRSLKHADWIMPLKLPLKSNRVANAQ